MWVRVFLILLALPSIVFGQCGLEYDDNESCGIDEGRLENMSREEYERLNETLHGLSSGVRDFLRQKPVRRSRGSTAMLLFILVVVGGGLGFVAYLFKEGKVKKGWR